MNENQRTIKKSVTLSGVGLHTGNPSTITFHPAPENYGFKFVRADLEGNPEIPALVDYVTDIARGTTITCNGASVHTVEHVLAALVGLEIDNCKMELTANEPPIGDGSALPYAEVLLQAGFEEQKAQRDFIVIDQMLRYVNESKQTEIVALPNDDFRITVMIDYQNSALASQHSGLFNLQSEFLRDFAPARTFCFLTEVESLHEQGLIRGGSLDNAIVIVDKEIPDEELRSMLTKFDIEQNAVLGQNGILNNRLLRFKNEPARHKLLDMLGDLALIGAPIKGQILAARPGHAVNIEFAKKIRSLHKDPKVQSQKNTQKQVPVLDINQILKVMPHRYPFLLVDRITEVDQEAKKIIGYKNVTINEPFFPGHFPERPIMPGVLIVEAMAQVGGLLLLNSDDYKEGKLVFFMAINNAKFRKPVIPGDQLMMEVTMTGKRFNTFAMSAKAFVDGALVAEAELSAAIVDSLPA
ncbi:MAG: bifunctional UDP-3-O-[3-hydroxymyristoyl] N-acetylglucosamine deacetylase/3-hydroxyacyl-ACP dehydratase [Bacteroidetes bacterium]|nr:bifunctional UDP-3-O-[3-hydroxymyristoyl] N-acetylglucosamine deacetylase/3-hydroxyacyl-ACP dehydratase [bacterium]NBP64799.1 bifunctional UDP-3-O-[3-hydroxymyristoyl] N-acetylglucosamine deacetylase/3-hydroxyacyl-ACP dehydratase [Bacteroidota bacterium]